MELRQPTVVERFMAHVEVRRATQCWWWLGPTWRGVYPRWRHDGYQYAVRYLWEVVCERDPLEPGDRFERVEHDWDHTCPGGRLCRHHLCMNPNHVRVVRRAPIQTKEEEDEWEHPQGVDE